MWYVPPIAKAAQNSLWARQKLTMQANASRYFLVVQAFEAGDAEPITDRHLQPYPFSGLSIEVWSWKKRDFAIYSVLIVSMS